MNPKKTPDMWLFAITIALLVIGLFMVFDASYARAGQVKYTGGDPFYFIKRQAIFAMAGLVLMFVAMRIPYWKLKRFGFVLLLVSIIGLAFVQVPGVGVMVNGARRWIHFAGITIQPSEFAKLGLVIYMVAYLSTRQRELRVWSDGLLKALFPLAPIAVLVMAQPDMGTTIVLCAMAVVMIYLAGAQKQHITMIIVAGLILGMLFSFSSPYRRERMTSFANPFGDYHESGYQVCQSLIALGSGGIFGVGLCEGKEKLFYLPEAHTDFILAVLGEEVGLIGTIIVAALFFMFAVRSYIIAFHTRETFGRLLAAGLGTLISGQALLNMCVVTSSVPATGVPLPFISYGGSSLALNLLCVGILLGISRYPGHIKGYQ